eukprot:CAMPEP_0170578706 /NCGR_PEP_ID=MMETSP0224-20130122/5598_1 /TAXON_ID=285029 /ORGANISM="Togula jolla, Strain CCCM 725" /LENGTH=345 /DNA_ID=CAMNT_0010901691 /DNA_START=19 /DNA_END=1056 /DNA_ORIENTATION=-
MGKSSVVVDCGTFTFKAGLSTDDRPSAAIQAPDGTPPKEAAETVFEDLFDKKLAVNLAEHSIVLAVGPSVTRRSREELTELLFFERHSARSVCVASTPFLATLGAGLSSALVLDVGEVFSSAVPVEEGYALGDCSVCGAPGGRLLTDAMGEMLQKAGVELPGGPAGRAAARLAKERLGCVAVNLKEELLKLQERPRSPRSSGLLSGLGSDLRQSLACEGVQCAELLFSPPTGRIPGIHEIIIDSLRLQSDVNLRGKLLGNILLTGASSMLTGLPERLRSEVQQRSPWVAPGKSVEEVNVVALAERNTLAWSGGAALANCDVFKDMCTSRADFSNHGARIIHRNYL